MATKLKQIQSLKQKLAPRQVLQARLLQLNTVNLEQAIIEELEQNPLLEQVETEEVQPDQNSDETPIDEIDVSMEDMYSDESTYYLSEQKSEMPLPDRVAAFHFFAQTSNRWTHHYTYPPSKHQFHQ